MTQQEDRNFMNMLIIVIGALFVFFILIIFIARLVVSGEGADAATDPMVEAATIERIKPFGEVNVGTAPVASASGASDAKGSYSASCAACHDSGAAGAPKLGDKGAWKKRIGQGIASMVKSVVNGKGAMPPKGGSTFSDEQIEAVVKYMVKKSK